MVAGPSWMIGAVKVTAVIENLTATPAEFLPDAGAPGALDPHRAWLTPWAMDEQGQLLFAIQALCLEADGRKIVVDTCIGPHRLTEEYAAVVNDGTFINALTAAGFGRDDVDLVVCTHLHFDHVGWNTIREDGKLAPTFRRARYLLPEVDYDHWKSAPEEQKANYAVLNMEDAVLPLFAAGVVDLIQPDHQISESLRVFPTPGHSPGHVSVRIASEGEEAVITGDCAHHPVQLAEPAWRSAVDFDPDLARKTRQKLIDDHTDVPVLLIGTHFRPPTAGHLVTVDGTVTFRPYRL